MRKALVLMAICIGLAQLIGCKGVGIVCSQSGSPDECGDGKICTFTRAPTAAGEADPNAILPTPVNVCLRQCTSSTDCGDGELCQVVYCSTLKSCQTGPLLDPPPDVCGGGGTGGAGGISGSGGGGGAAGTDGTGGTGGGGQACDSEAWAYIQTLDASFNRTNLVQFDTTNLPEDWDRYSISLDLTDPLLEDQILQFGFSATASNFEPSGVFYDNVLVETGAAAAGGAGGGGGTGSVDLMTEYEQNFESLDQASPTALGDDPDPLWGIGWLVFGNAFEADGTTFLYGYGPDPAPNNTGGFCGIALGQGGDDQGSQSLVIISDYNNQDQALGRRIEANTFRERSITGSDIGNVLRFSFDAKRGNINSVDEGCASPEP